MKFPIRALRWFPVLAGLALAACTPPKANDFAKVEWLTDGDKAINEARQQGRPLLIAFVGSDWSPASKDADKDVFNTHAFKDFADANLVLLRVDFTRDGLSPQLQTAYAQMAKSMQVDRLPVFYLADPANGTGIFQRFNGFGGGGPMEFISQVTNALSQYHALLSAHQAQAAQPATPPPTVLQPGTSDNGLPTPQQLLEQVRSQPQMAPGVSVGQPSTVAPIGMPSRPPGQNPLPGVQPPPGAPSPNPMPPAGTTAPLIDLTQ